MKLISRIFLSIIVLLASGPGHSAGIPLLTLDASGANGRQARAGVDYSTTEAPQGANGQRFSDADADGRTATNGANGGSMDLKLSPGTTNGSVIISGTISNPQTGSSNFNQSLTYVNTTAAIVLNSRGGDAAPGGVGGGGQIGGVGFQGKDADPENQDATPGTPGGRGGPGGNGTQATVAGNGGTIKVNLPSDQTHLLMLFQTNVIGGGAGQAGANGAGGAGGTGGPGGNGIEWTEQGETGETTREERPVIDPQTGQPKTIERMQDVTVPDFEDRVVGQKPVLDANGEAAVDGDGNPIMEDDIRSVEVGSHIVSEPVLDGNNRPIFDEVTEIVDVPVIREVQKSKPGAEPGPTGEIGVDGVGNITASRPGLNGNYSIFVTQPNGAVVQYKSRYNLVVTGYSYSANSNNGVFEPGDSVTVSKITVKNVSDMPMPSGQNALLTIENSGWIIAGSKAVVIPASLAPGQEMTLTDSQVFTVKDNTITPGLSTTATIVPDIQLQGVNRYFEAVGGQMSFQVSYPVSIKQLPVDLTKLDPNGKATITYQITNTGKRDIGAKADLARAVQLVVKTGGGGTLDTSQITIFDSTGKPVQNGASAITEIPVIKAGQTISLTTQISIGPRASRNTTGSIVAELHLQSPTEAANIRAVQTILTPVGIEGLVKGILRNVFGVGQLPQAQQQQQTRALPNSDMIAMQRAQQISSANHLGPILSCEDLFFVK